MSFNWSNPSQGQTNTAAQIQSQYKPETVSIAPIVAALLQKQYHDQEIQQQQYQDMIKGIGSAASGYANYQNAGAANDSANAAMYGMQNPSDPMGGYQDPNRVPDYGGTDALKAYLMQQKATTNPLDDQLTQARIDAEKALTTQRNNNPFGGGNSQMTPRQNINTLKDAQTAAGDAFDQYDVPDRILNDPNAIHAPSDQPAVYSKGTQATTVPQGQYLYVDPKDNSYHYVSQDYLDQARQASNTYRQAQQTYRGALNPASPPAAQLPPPNPSGGQGVRQGDVDQSSQALQQEGNYPVGTHARAGSVWYVKTATGWQADPSFSQ
jgi:hypothetical protein